MAIETAVVELHSLVGTGLAREARATNVPRKSARRKLAARAMLPALLLHRQEHRLRPQGHPEKRGPDGVQVL